MDVAPPTFGNPRQCCPILTIFWPYGQIFDRRASLSLSSDFLVTYTLTCQILYHCRRIIALSELTPPHCLSRSSDVTASLRHCSHSLYYKFDLWHPKGQKTQTSGLSSSPLLWGSGKTIRTSRSREYKAEVSTSLVHKAKWNGSLALCKKNHCGMRLISSFLSFSLNTTGKR